MGGTLTTFLTPEPPILINAINFQSPTIIIGSKIYQALLKYAFDLTPMPQLAKEWEVSPDALTYTFHLQDNVKWHDGQDFTADDVIFSLMKFHMEMSPRARSILRKVVDANAADAHTVRLTLDSPFEPFLLAFDVATLPMLPKHIYDGTDYRTNPMNQKPVGTGAFAFAEWQRGNFIRLRKFPYYWKFGQPYLDEIIYRIAPDSQSRELALQTGQVLYTQANDIEPFDVPRLREHVNLTVETRGWEMFSPLMWIEVNHRVKPLDDKRVRQALDPIPPNLNLARLLEERLRRRRRPWRAAAAVALALGLGAGTGWFAGRRPATGVTTIAQEAATNYAVYAVDKRRPVEVWATQKDDLTHCFRTGLTDRFRRPTFPACNISSWGAGWSQLRTAPRPCSCMRTLAVSASPSMCVPCRTDRRPLSRPRTSTRSTAALGLIGGLVIR